MKIAAAKLLEYRDVAKTFFEEILYIRDHNTAAIVPFRMNKGQEILHNIAEKQKGENGYVRVLLLKSRRFGGSTYVEARFYWRTALNFNRNTFIVGHEEESTNTLFRMAKLFQEKNVLQPSTLASNAQELRFDNKQGTGLKSEYRLATARNVNAGRSQGIHYLHISEEAYWPAGANELLLGLFQCVPDPPAESEIFRESTANGYGNTFQEAVMKSYAGGLHPYYQEDGITYAWSSPDTDWVLVFIPWFVHERYKKDFDNEDMRKRFEERISKQVYDKEEMKWVESPESELRRRYNLSLEQLHWREWAIENKCAGSVDKFNQEYPASVMDAFLSKGSNVYSRKLCDHLESQCADPLIVGDVYQLAGRARVKRNKHGSFTVWEEANQRDSYYITVDCAGGKKAEDDEPDKTNIDVWNHRTGLQAAQWNGHIHYDLIADLVMMIGDLYGIRYKGALELPIAAVELNNHGFTVVAALENAHYPQYYFKPNNPGWSTNRRTKPQMVDSLYRYARDGSLKINSKGTINEMRTYIEDGGTYNAAPGCNDDRVITAAIAAEIMNLLPRKYKEPRSNRIGRATGFKNWQANDNDKTPEYVEYYA